MSFVVYDDSSLGVKVIIIVCQLPPPVKDTQIGNESLTHASRQVVVVLECLMFEIVPSLLSVLGTAINRVLCCRRRRQWFVFSGHCMVRL